MDFTLTQDQTTLMGALDSLAERYASKPTDAHGFTLLGSALERELEESGFFEIAAEPDLGPVSAAMAVERLARLPYAAEVAFSMLVLLLSSESRLGPVTKAVLLKAPILVGFTTIVITSSSAHSHCIGSPP